MAAIGTVVMVSTPAAAHGQFVRSVPAAGETVTEALEAIYLYFSEKPTSNAYLAVTAPSGVRVDRLWSHGPTEEITPAVHEWYHQADGRWVVRAYSTAYSAMIPIAYWPEAGDYKVEYLSVATDGQPVRGEFTFAYTGPVSELPADFVPQRSEPDPNLLAIAAPGAPTAPPTGPPIEEIVAAEEAGPGLWVVWVPLGIVLAIVAAGIVYWRLRPEEARELVVSRFGGRYTAPTQRGPAGVAAAVAERVQERLPARLRGRRGPAELPAPRTAGEKPSGDKAEKGDDD
jgi:methionine-rich copper-binding protein CopC